MRIEMKTKTDIESGLIASSDLSRELRHPGNDIRPCIAQMLENSYSKGDYPDRNTVALIIASELRRIGSSMEEVEWRVARWNENNNPPLRYSEYIKAVNNAFGKEYNYSCEGGKLDSTCIGKEMCPFYRGALGKRKSYNNRPFISYQWPRLLNNAAKDIYIIALVELERRRQVGPGGLIFTAQREIADIAGISRRSVKPGLEELVHKELIDYKPGKPRLWEGKASEIRRIIPIPKPPIELLRSKGVAK